MDLQPNFVFNNFIFFQNDGSQSTFSKIMDVSLITNRESIYSAHISEIWKIGGLRQLTDWHLTDQTDDFQN